MSIDDRQGGVNEVNVSSNKRITEFKVRNHQSSLSVKVIDVIAADMLWRRLEV